MSRAKMMRRQFRKTLRDNVRVIFRRLCGLPLGERLRLAWLLVRGDANLDRAAKRRDGQ